MAKIIPILLLLVLASCSSKYDKTKVMNSFSEIQELNQILIKHKEKLYWKNNPDSISHKIQETRKLIELLKVDLELTEIEIHKEIDRKPNTFGIAYRFGNPTKDRHYSYLIFSEDTESLDSFRQYEQFSDCGKQEIINRNWSYSIRYPDCNN